MALKFPTLANRHKCCLSADTYCGLHYISHWFGARRIIVQIVTYRGRGNMWACFFAKLQVAFYVILNRFDSYSTFVFPTIPLALEPFFKTFNQDSTFISKNQHITTFFHGCRKHFKEVRCNESTGSNMMFSFPAKLGKRSAR